MFTDIVGSTRMWDRAGIEMAEALEVHDRLLRQVIEERNGNLFAATGDGFAAAFHTVDAAALAALDCQLTLRQDDRSSGLHVRIGVHTGVAVERDNNYFGPVLNRAARLMSVAHGGQVLLSGATKSLLSDDIDTIDLGVHRLPDLAEPLRVYQVVADGLDADHPPLRTLDGTIGNLPVQMTSFVGRVDETARLRASIDAHRLVTLIGVGGTGKTRLALQTGAEVAHGFDDGVWLIELGPVGDESGVVERFMTVLGIRPAAGVPREQRLVEVLAGREMLLIVDNCEHVLDAVARLVDHLLRGLPTVRVVATSREPLLVSGEQIMAVPSLETSDIDSDAVTLFIERCGTEEAEPGMAFNEGVVRDICARLDGIPLAIELAASRARSMGVGEILDRLNERFRLLKGGRRTTAERHQTLRATVDWSYRLLTDTERVVFDRLSVFAAFFSIDDAVAVCADETLDDFEVGEAVASLVEKSMCTMRFDGTSHRYRLLETLRAYGQENLETAGEIDARRLRHAQHFAGLSVDITEAIHGPDEVDAARKYQSSASDTRAALIWAAHVGEFSLVEDFLPVIHTLGWRGVLETQGWLGEIDDLLPRTPIIVGALAHDALFNRGDPSLAQRLADEILGLHDNAAGLYSAHRILGLCAMFNDDVEIAVGHFLLEREASLVSPVWYEKLYGGFLLATTQPYLGVDSRWLADEMLATAQAREWVTARALGHYMLGHALESEDPHAADTAYRTSAGIAESVGNEATWGWATRERLLLDAQHADPHDVAPELCRVLDTQVAFGGTIDTLVSMCSAILVLDHLGHHELVAVVAGHVGQRGRPFDPAARSAYEQAVARAHQDIEGTWNEATQRGNSLTTRETVDLIDAALTPTAPAGPSPPTISTPSHD